MSHPSEAWLLLDKRAQGWRWLRRGPLHHGAVSEPGQNDRASLWPPGTAAELRRAVGRASSRLQNQPQHVGDFVPTVVTSRGLSFSLCKREGGTGADLKAWSRPEASAPPGNVLEMHVPGPRPRPAASGSRGTDHRVLARMFLRRWTSCPLRTRVAPWLRRPTW